MGAARDMTQADFDLERFIDMFDEALTSKDERVVNALRSLMMMVILTNPEGRKDPSDRDHGPLRQLVDDLRNINRRLHDTEQRVRSIEQNGFRNHEHHEWSREKYWPQVAAAQMAQEIDEGVMRSITRKINSGNHPLAPAPKIKGSK